MGNDHALVVPYPMQGHVIPFMELSLRLVERGFKVTFMNTESNHKRIAATMQNSHQKNQISMVSISDGLTNDDRNDIGKLTEAVSLVFPREVEAFIRNTNGSGSKDNVTCLISDMRWLLKIGTKIGIKTATFWTTGAGTMAQLQSIPKLIESGVISQDGTLLKDQKIQLSPSMYLMETTHLIWLCVGDLNAQKIAFDASLKAFKDAQEVDWKLCNTSYELEPEPFELLPHVVPIGPLLPSNGIGQSVGHFWPQDSSCLKWLDQQPARSVVYVAFGSFTMFDVIQFQELAMGLELSNQQFLWVVRPDMTEEQSKAYPQGFQQRVANQAQMVGWAPQQKVLSHPSIACFLSHCGWNSTLESVTSGVPFLCWPYFADQLLNQSLICDVWKIGLRLNKNERGIVSRTEIQKKVNDLLRDKEIRTRISHVKEVVKKSLTEGGTSSTNFDKFVNGMKTC